MPNKIPLIKTGFIQAVNGELYKVFVNAINTTENAIAPLSTKFVTNGSPGRSRNWELSRILYFNIGYLDFSSWYNLSSDWRYRSLTFATDLFRETSAHEIGHEVLLAYGGHIYSKKHKETSTILQSENAGLKYPSGEIDLMKYFDEVYAPDFRKVIASEKDVLSLIWLTKLELK
ncbi:hypothetical protein [Tenacibaculum maritimum]|uniref:hypothetical protein n=1 Tax=Tenacibaculum maritimum TaxID=107401 RepID=UPI0038773A8D